MLLAGEMTQGPPEVEAVPSPAHEVTLSPYCLDVHEVTVGAYRACVKSGSCGAPLGGASLAGEVDAAVIAEISVHCTSAAALAANCVDWTMAETYCRSVGGALPTEAQWEFAARGTEGRRFPWGEELPTGLHVNVIGAERELTAFQQAQHMERPIVGSDGFVGVAPPGRFPAGATPDGVQDLGGNLSEWTADWVGPYTTAAVSDPTGPVVGAYRVTRGGSFFTLDRVDMTGAMRRGSAPVVRDPTIGFRCASTP